MNSVRLQAFSRSLANQLIERAWADTLKISPQGLSRVLALAQRQLFAEAAEHPTLSDQVQMPSLRSVLATQCWLVAFAVGVYAANLAMIASLVIRRRRWHGESGAAGICALAPPGRAFETYSTTLERLKGMTVCVLGPQSRRLVSSYSTALAVRFETLMSPAPLDWLRPLWFLVNEVPFVAGRVQFECPDREKSFARFLYVVLKQATMVSRAHQLTSRFKGVKTLMLSSEDLSVPLLESARAAGHRTAHHLHGTVLQGNMLAEPPLAGAVIVACDREREIFSSYAGLATFTGTAPFQMHDDLRRAQEPASTQQEFDVVLIGSFELPFIQKSTYGLLTSALTQFQSRRMLLRHHPRAPANSKALLEAALPSCEISRGHDLLSDIRRARVVLCCAVDPLVVCLRLNKPTIFLPMTDGDYQHYTAPLAGQLRSLRCPNSADALVRDLEALLTLETDRSYSADEQVIEYLAGSSDMRKFDAAVTSITMWNPSQARAHD